MRRAAKQVTNGRKTKAKLSDRSQALFERIRRRRGVLITETRHGLICERVGLLSDSSELIRKERDRRF